MATGEALGLLDPELTPEEGWARMAGLWSDRPEDADFRRRITRLFASQSMEFREHNVEYGYTYDSTAVVDDGSPLPAPVDPIRVYEPSTRPGSPLPHAWLDTDTGQRISTLDLVHPGRFLLIAGEDGDRWCEAAAKLAVGGGIPLDSARIGHLEGDYLDPRCRWARPSARSAPMAPSWCGPTGSSRGAASDRPPTPMPSSLPPLPGCLVVILPRSLAWFT